MPPASTSVEDALAWLERAGTPKGVAEMARYGITAEKAFGVSVGKTKELAKEIGKDHALALELWETGWYEARLLAAFVDDPLQVSAEQMDAWAADFDSWAVVDTVAFHLFDRTPHAWEKAHEWSVAEPEFAKRAAFALMWALSAHDRKAPDASFLACLPLLEEGARDDRNFVKKAVDMALRAIGKRNPTLHAAALATAERLAASTEPSARWVGRHTLRELTSAKVRERFAG